MLTLHCRIILMEHGLSNRLSIASQTVQLICKYFELWLSLFKTYLSWPTGGLKNVCKP